MSKTLKVPAVPAELLFGSGSAEVKRCPSCKQMQKKMVLWFGRLVATQKALVKLPVLSKSSCGLKGSYLGHS